MAEAQHADFRETAHLSKGLPAGGLGRERELPKSISYALLAALDAGDDEFEREKRPVDTRRASFHAWRPRSVVG